MFLASNLDEFRLLFTAKLKDMLSPDELGAYILVLANSIQDEDLRFELHDVLIKNEQILGDKIKSGMLQSTQDDLEVFRRLTDVGTSQVPSWNNNRIGVWEVMSNPFRALRPTRASRERFTSIQQGYDAEKFNFNKPFLKPEILWEGAWKSSGKQSFDLKVLYNKFPFIPYHLIIVPDSNLQRPQFLSSYYHDVIWNLVAETNQNLPGFGVGYNSLGACASVNHLHFQSFIQESVLPVELHQWSHNGGDVSYPMTCETFRNKQQAWDAIQEMNEKDVPYNILYRPEQCYLIPRKRQGDVTIIDAVAGAGWIEQCGVFVEGSNDVIESLTESNLEESLKSLSI